MKLTLAAALSGRSHRTSACPHCQSASTRASRRNYDGVFGKAFGFRPIKCLACGAYFALRGSVLLPATPETTAATQARFELVAPPRQVRFSNRTRVCPGCGSPSIRAQKPGPLESRVARLSFWSNYRCSTCNAIFSRLDPVRAFITFAASSLVLALMTYGVFWIVARRTPSSSPSSVLKNDRVPNPPPPVFRGK